MDPCGRWRWGRLWAVWPVPARNGPPGDGSAGASGLGELLDFDFETLSLMQMYRASDALMKHRQAIEAHLFTRAMGLFDLQPTVTLFDLTNTFFERGRPAVNPRRSGGTRRRSAATVGC